MLASAITGLTGLSSLALVRPALALVVFVGSEAVGVRSCVGRLVVAAGELLDACSEPRLKLAPLKDGPARRSMPGKSAC